MVLAHNRTEFGGVEPSIVDATFEGNNLKVTIQWFNGNDKQIMVGEDFQIERYVDDNKSWESCVLYDDPVFRAIGYPIKSGESYCRTYDFSLFNLMTAGTYRWKSDFITDGTGIQTDV